MTTQTPHINSENPEFTPAPTAGTLSPTAIISAADSSPSAPVKKNRIKGIDLARALALMGMMAAHFGASSEFGKSFWDSVGAITHGRSSLLFAVLAGVSIALMTGGANPLDRSKVVGARSKILLRAMFILLIGSALNAIGSGIDIILPTYALLFIIAIPFLQASRKTLIWWSIGFVTVGAALSFALKSFMYSISLPIPFLDFIAGGNYSLLPWCGVILAGMAVGRSNLSTWKNVATMAGIGAVIAAAAYSSTIPFNSTSNEGEGDKGSKITDGYTSIDPFESWIKEDPTGTGSVNGTPVSTVDVSDLSCDAAIEKNLDYDYTYLNCYSNSNEMGGELGGENGGEEPSGFQNLIDSLPMFGTASPHSGTTAEVLGGIGVAFIVISVCLALCAKTAFLWRPLTAFGSMPLTLYSAHVLTFKYVFEMEGTFALWPWTISVVVGSVFAMIWLRFFARGPLETVMTWFINAFLRTPSALASSVSPMNNATDISANQSYPHSGIIVAPAQGEPNTPSGENSPTV